jgi:hypothetical protein
MENESITAFFFASIQGTNPSLFSRTFFGSVGETNFFFGGGLIAVIATIAGIYVLMFRDAPLRPL